MTLKADRDAALFSTPEDSGAPEGGVARRPVGLSANGVRRRRAARARGEVARHRRSRRFGALVALAAAGWAILLLLWSLWELGR